MVAGVARVKCVVLVVVVTGVARVKCVVLVVTWVARVKCVVVMVTGVARVTAGVCYQGDSWSMSWACLDVLTLPPTATKVFV